MGLLDIFRKGLTNTRNFFSSGFTKIAAGTGHFDDGMLDELEEHEDVQNVHSNFDIPDDVIEAMSK